MSKPLPSHGGYRWSLPEDLRRVRINATLDPGTIELLKPFVSIGMRGQIIDVAIGVLLGNGDLEAAQRKVSQILQGRQP